MYSHQRSKVTCMWKIIFVDRRPVGGQRGGSIGTLTQLPRNAPRDFFQTHARRCGVVSQDILCFRADAWKLILGSVGTPLDHLSFNVEGGREKLFYENESSGLFFFCYCFCCFLFCFVFVCLFLKPLKFVWGVPNGTFYGEIKSGMKDRNRGGVMGATAP